MKQLESIYRATFLATALAVVTGLTACGGGGGGGSANTFTASCSDGTTKTSSVSQADAQSQCSTASTALSTNTPTANYASSDKLNVFNQLNADRLRCGFGSMQQNTKLDTAAQGHSDYMALNTLDPTHTQTSSLLGFTGTTLTDRLAAAGYSYTIASEALNRVDYGTWFTQGGSVFPQSATPLAATNNLRRLYSTVYHLSGLMSGYREVGIGVSIKDTTGGGYTSFLKYVVIEEGTPSTQLNQRIASDALVTFPCEGVSGLNPYFGPENPNPFPSVDLSATPYGTPVYLMSAIGTNLTVTSSSITQRGVGPVPTTQVNTTNDPMASGSLDRLASNQVFVVPTTHLANNATYDVVLSGTNSGLITATNPTGSFTRSFSFQTGTYTSD
jgi:hypothetical protein